MNPNKTGDPTVVAFYLPQFHPIPENDAWWGKGFTEWTNVGRAKALFPGHDQPKVPKDLGYYDLRLPAARIAQAEMAKAYGVDGFCYWHYWFGEGRRLLETPFTEVVRSGEPDFPFCLGWANHSWKKKTWSNDATKDAVLMEQRYPGLQDHEAHFHAVVEAFQDPRYIRVDGRPVFLVWEPMSVPDNAAFMDCWNRLARQHGLPGIHFIGFTYEKRLIDAILAAGYEAVVYDALNEVRWNLGLPRRAYNKLMKLLWSIPTRVPYATYVAASMAVYRAGRTIPCVLPNFDHTPRSGERGLVLESDPAQFGAFLDQVLALGRQGQLKSPLLFIKSWNEWGEGNYLEPDLKHGTAFLEQLRARLRRADT